MNTAMFIIQTFYIPMVPYKMVKTNKLFKPIRIQYNEIEYYKLIKNNLISFKYSFHRRGGINQDQRSTHLYVARLKISLKKL